MNKSTSLEIDRCTLSLPSRHHMTDDASSSSMYQHTNSDCFQDDPSGLCNAPALQNICALTHPSILRESSSLSLRLPPAQSLPNPQLSHLSRSKTTIIDVPAVRAGRMVDAEQQCDCDACMKWAEYENSTRTHFANAEIDNDSPEVTEMKRIYRSFEGVKPKVKFIDRIGYYVPITMHNKSKPLKKRIRKR